MEGILNDEPYYKWTVLFKYFNRFYHRFYLHICVLQVYLVSIEKNPFIIEVYFKITRYFRVLGRRILKNVQRFFPHQTPKRMS